MNGIASATIYILKAKLTMFAPGGKVPDMTCIIFRKHIFRPITVDTHMYGKLQGNACSCKSVFKKQKL